MRPHLMRAVQAFQDDIVRFAQKLIQTPSLSGAEGRIAELTQREMERLGYDRTWRDEVGNVIGLMKGEDGGKSDMLNSHLDHVDVGDQSQWEFPPYGAIVADDFIWGRAACDVKGALAVQIYAPAIARKAGLRVPSDVYMTAVVLEERGGWGSEHIAQTLKADYAILGEATGNELRVGHRGRIEMQVRFLGRSVHASAPARGANPHYAMARFLSRLRDLRMVSDELFGHSTVAPTTVTTDQSSPNVTPGEICLTLDWRNLPSETPEQILGKVQHLLDEVHEPGVSARVEVPQIVLSTYTGLSEAQRLIHPAYYMPETHPFVQSARRVLRAALDREIELGTWAFATDGGHLMQAGIPTIGFAPGEERLAHTTQDRVAIAQLTEAAVGYLALLENLS